MVDSSNDAFRAELLWPPSAGHHSSHSHFAELQAAACQGTLHNTETSDKDDNNFCSS